MFFSLELTFIAALSDNESSAGCGADGNDFINDMGVTGDSTGNAGVVDNHSIAMLRQEVSKKLLKLVSAHGLLNRTSKSHTFKGPARLISKTMTFLGFWTC